MTAIVTPMKNQRSPELGPVAVMAATRPDFRDLATPLGLDRSRQMPLFTSQLCLPAPDGGPCLAGPMIGAPYAVMVMETLIAWGATTFFFMGWCGAVSPQVHIGDIVLAGEAIVDEGTSAHYGGRSGGIVSCPPGALAGRTADLLKDLDIPWHAGRIWTTDAIYRETEDVVRQRQKQGALAVEMETSALFSVAAFRQVEIVSLLVVSDELGSLTWRPGFKDSRFARARQAAATIAGRLMEPQAL